VIPYFQVDFPDGDSEIQQLRQESLSRLTHFFRLLPAAPVPPIFPPSSPNHQTSTFVIRTHFFIQLEIFHCQKAKHERSKKSLDGLLAALIAMDHPAFIVKIDFDRLFQHYLSDPPAVYALKLKDDLAVADISQNDLLLVKEEQNLQVLTQILFSRTICQIRNDVIVRGMDRFRCTNLRRGSQVVEQSSHFSIFPSIPVEMRMLLSGKWTDF
jgi:hypothetical protein